jgi:hypothetical protein
MVSFFGALPPSAAAAPTSTHGWAIHVAPREARRVADAQVWYAVLEDKDAAENAVRRLAAITPRHDVRVGRQIPASIVQAMGLEPGDIRQGL